MTKNLKLLVACILFWGLTATGAKAQYDFSGLSGLIQWQKPESLVGTAENATIQTWVDSSGHSNDMTQATSGTRPKWHTNSIGTYGAVNFTGSKNLSNTLVDGTGSASGTVYIVYRLYGTVPTNSYLMSAFGRDSQLTGKNYSGRIADNIGTGPTSITTYAGLTPRPNDFGVFCSSYNSSTTTWTTEDTGESQERSGLTGPGAGTMTINGSTTRLGRTSAGGNFDGAVAEFILCNQAHNRATMIATRNLLCAKYGIAINGIVVHVGDSLTAGSGATGYQGYLNYQALPLFRRRYTSHVNGYSGLGTTAIDTNAQTSVDPWYDASRPKNVVVWWTGANSISGGGSNAVADAKGVVPAVKPVVQPA